MKKLLLILLCLPMIGLGQNLEVLFYIYDDGKVEKRIVVE